MTKPIEERFLSVNQVRENWGHGRPRTSGLWQHKPVAKGRCSVCLVLSDTTVKWGGPGHRNVTLCRKHLWFCLDRRGRTDSMLELIYGVASACSLETAVRLKDDALDAGWHGNVIKRMLAQFRAVPSDENPPLRPMSLFDADQYRRGR